MGVVNWVALAVAAAICLALAIQLRARIAALRLCEAERSRLASRLDTAQKVGGLGVWDAWEGSSDVQWSAGHHAIFGTTPETFTPTYEAFLEFVHPEDRDGVASVLGKMEADGLTGIEYRIVRRDGGIRYIRQTWEIQADAATGARRALGACLDITEWRQREEDLRLYRSIIEASREAICIVDPHGRFTFVNKATEELFGRPLAEATHLTFRDYCEPEHVAVAEAGLARAMIHGETWQGSVDAIDARGRRFPLWIHADSLRDSRGNLAWGFAVMHDLTAIRRAEDALRESEERYRSVVFNLEEGIVLRTREGNVVAANPSADRINVNFEQARGVDGGDPDWEAIHEDGSPVDIKTEQPALVALRTGKRQTGIIMGFRRADRTLSWFSINCQPLIRVGESEPYAVVSSFTDITEIKRVERELRATLREKQGLLMEIHHRVKNNLQVITSLLRLESGRAAEAPVRGVLNDMQARVRAMGVLHETLYRSGEFGKVDLKPYLTQLVDQFFQGQARSSAVRSVTEISSAFVAVEQAIPCGLLLNELLTNSLKHGFPDGRPGEVRVSLDIDEGHLRLRVSDNGVGLPSDFEARRTVSLGLQLVGDLARQLGGALEVGPGPGACFSVRFKPKETLHDAGAAESRV